MPYRIMQKFWLDVSKHDERELAQQIVELKDRRAFARSIRDALKLFLDLKQGKVAVLCELFPWVKEAFQSAPVAPVEQGLQEQIARLETLLLAQGNVPIQSPLAPESARTNRKSRVNVTATTGKADARTVAQNFANSMKSFASGFFD